MEHLQKDVEVCAKEALHTIKENIEQQAEYYAEKYVSSTLGMYDDHMVAGNVDIDKGAKENIKKQYIEHFTEKVKELL